MAEQVAAGQAGLRVRTDSSLLRQVGGEGGAALQGGEEGLVQAGRQTLLMRAAAGDWSVRGTDSWGLGRGWEVAVNGTPVKGSFGGRPQVASLFWCSSSVLLSTDTPLGSSMGSSMTSWVIWSRNSSGMERLLGTGRKKQIITIGGRKAVFIYSLEMHHKHTPWGCRWLNPADRRGKNHRSRRPPFAGFVDSFNPLHLFRGAAASRLPPHGQRLEPESRRRAAERQSHAELRHRAQREQTPTPQILLPTVGRLRRQRGEERGPGAEI
ncbi:hypothetical protein EYF80_039610 [Liparis tanakae]|uniref:Uncharacterized protein n=1 Tax=Liparis tanakae TaxID=230148 RepID=A0A4Z2G9F6_9TELE|nr:hypothetical protein EYF80_039610 [Liparis tanakae]